MHIWTTFTLRMTVPKDDSRGYLKVFLSEPSRAPVPESRKNSVAS